MNLTNALNAVLMTAVCSFSSSALAGSADDAKNSWQGRTLDFQYHLQDSRAMGDSLIFGTHNSFNSRAYSNPTRYFDPQHKYSIYDQLTLGARYISLDAHWTAHTHGWPWEWGTDLLLCHSGIGESLGDLHVGCSTTDRKVWSGLDEIRDWFNEKKESDEVVIVSIQDETEGRHKELYNVIKDRLGDRIYNSGGCGKTFAELSKQDVLAAGKNVIVLMVGRSSVDTCSGYEPLRNMAFDESPGFSSVYEDGTLINDLMKLVGQKYRESISADDIRGYVKEGEINNLELAWYTQDDGRIDAGLWSWASNEPNNHDGRQDCAAQYGRGHNSDSRRSRWDDAYCDSNYRYACLNPDNSQWTVTSQSGPWEYGVEACHNLGDGYIFAAPQSGKENADLYAQNSQNKIWINLNDKEKEGHWVKGNSEDWIHCATEGSTCHVNNQIVRYGAKGKYTLPRKESSSFSCNNDKFGDPIKGTKKACQKRVETLRCATEGSYCDLAGETAVVVYGTATHTVEKTVSGGIDCTNSAFGSDPKSGVKKYCRVAY